jgi:hypothetical protein
MYPYDLSGCMLFREFRCRESLPRGSRNCEGRLQPTTQISGPGCFTRARFVHPILSDKVESVGITGFTERKAHITVQIAVLSDATGGR